MSMCGEIENLEFEIKTKELELARLKKRLKELVKLSEKN